MKKIELGTIALLIAVISMAGACVVIAPADSSVAPTTGGDVAVAGSVINLDDSRISGSITMRETGSPEEGCFMTAEFVFTQMFLKIYDAGGCISEMASGLKDKIDGLFGDDEREPNGYPVPV